MFNGLAESFKYQVRYLGSVLCDRRSNKRIVVVAMHMVECGYEVKISRILTFQQ
jgi:hypothetical protein